MLFHTYLFKLQFIGIKIANNPSNTLHYLQKAHLSSDTKLIDLADINIYDASVHTGESDFIRGVKHVCFAGDKLACSRAEITKFH